MMVEEIAENETEAPNSQFYFTPGVIISTSCLY